MPSCIYVKWVLSYFFFFLPSVVWVYTAWRDGIFCLVNCVFMPQYVFCWNVGLVGRRDFGKMCSRKCLFLACVARLFLVCKIWINLNTFLLLLVKQNLKDVSVFLCWYAIKRCFYFYLWDTTGFENILFFGIILWYGNIDLWNFIYVHRQQIVYHVIEENILYYVWVVTWKA